MPKRRNTYANVQVKFAALFGDFLPREQHPDLASRLELERGWSIERVGDLYRLAGGRRWKSSVAEGGTSTCARALRTWLSASGLQLYSNRALVVAHEGNGHAMTHEVLRQLQAGDRVVVVDPRQERGSALLSGELMPEDDWPLDELPERTAHDDRIRVANVRDVAAVASLRSRK